jgi:hypothetical protein
MPQPKPFEVCGPFSLGDHIKCKRITQTKFWDAVENNKYRGLRKAHGIYLFSIKNKGSHKLWYVGKTKAKNGFANEGFNARNIKLYKRFYERKNGEPYIFLIARRKNKQRGFVTNPSSEHIKWLEFTLLGLSWRANQNIKNDKGKQFIDAIRVRGILYHKGGGKPSAEPHRPRAPKTMTEHNPD